MPIDLTALGWTSRLAETFAPHAAEGLVPARVALDMPSTVNGLGKNMVEINQ